MSRLKVLVLAAAMVLSHKATAEEPSSQNDVAESSVKRSIKDRDGNDIPPDPKQSEVPTDSARPIKDREGKDIPPDSQRLKAPKASKPGDIKLER